VGYLLFARLGYNKPSLRLWHGLAFRGYFVKMGTQRSVTLAVLLVGLLCSPALGLRRTTKHAHHTGKGRFRRLFWNPMFRPSHDSLLRQNEEIDRLDLPRIYDDDELEQLKLSEALVPINQSQYLRFDPRLDPNRRYCRPWTRDFLEDLSQAYYHRFHDQIQVNSAVRTVLMQRRLRRHNRNAAPESGETASSHLAGLTVDIQRRGMSRDQVRFVERYLFYLRALGLVEPEEERHQWVFHVMVGEGYADWRQTQTIAPIAPQIPVEAVQAANK